MYNKDFNKTINLNYFAPLMYNVYYILTKAYEIKENSAHVWPIGGRKHNESCDSFYFSEYVIIHTYIYMKQVE